jgi:hypothetical protein
LVREGLLDRAAIEEAFSDRPSRNQVLPTEISRHFDVEMWARSLESALLVRSNRMVPALSVDEWPVQPCGALARWIMNTRPRSRKAELVAHVVSSPIGIPSNAQARRPKDYDDEAALMFIAG